MWRPVLARLVAIFRFVGCGSATTICATILSMKSVNLLTGGEEKGALFQMRPTGGAWQTFKEWTGMGIAATVTMKTVGAALEIEVGGGKWLDKAAIAGIATFVTLGVLVIPASVGAWKQKKLLQEMRDEINAFFRKEATVPKCPDCDVENAAEAKFCNACGKPMK